MSSSRSGHSSAAQHHRGGKLTAVAAQDVQRALQRCPAARQRPLTAVVELVALEDGDEDPDTDDELVGVADTVGVQLLVAVVLPVELLLAVIDDEADEELLVDAVADGVCTESASGKT